MTGANEWSFKRWINSTTLQVDDVDENEMRREMKATGRERERKREVDVKRRMEIRGGWISNSHTLRGGCCSAKREKD